MVLIGMTTYIESNRKNMRDPIFIMPLLIESLITCDIIRDFDYSSDHQHILFMWTMPTVNNPLSSWLLLRIMDISSLKKSLAKELGKNSSCISITFNKLDIKVHSWIKVIDIVMTFGILKVRLFLKSIPGFDEKCKKI